MLKQLFSNLYQVFDEQPVTEGRLAIQDIACAELAIAIAADSWPDLDPASSPLPRPYLPRPYLPQPYLDVLEANKTRAICRDIMEMPFAWAPPETSKDPLYLAHSRQKAHVEILGPEGLVHCENVRMGLYGILPHIEYGIRTHPAEEIFIMLAGEADWIRGEGGYKTRKAGEYSYHPSGMRHATRTNDLAFMSVYVWTGDVSTDEYDYQGYPQEPEGR